MLKSLLFLATATGLSLAASTAWACNARLHLDVGPTGVYQLGYAEAIKAQPKLANCPLAELAMSSDGNAVPLRIEDNGDGRFGPGDKLEWIGIKAHGPESWNSPFTRVHAYELSARPGEHPRFGVRKPTQIAATATMTRHVHLEHDLMMMRLEGRQVHKGEWPDLWYWSKMTMVDPTPFTTHFDLPGLATKRAPMTLHLAFRGWSSVPARKGQPKTPDHRVVVELNGTTVATLEWSGNAHEVRDVTLPPPLLRATGNELVMRVPARKPDWNHGNSLVDVVMFDYLDLDYPLDRADAKAPFRVDAAGAPRLAAGDAPVLFGSDGTIYPPQTTAGVVRYAAVPAATTLYPLAADKGALTPIKLRAIDDAIDWHQPDQGYDYVIIAHPSLLEATRPLAEFHRSRGHRVALIDVDTIYDEFSHGNVDPRAIRAFLANAAKRWPAPKLHYVLLVGDASFDLSDHHRDQKFYAKWSDRELLYPGQFGTIPGTPYKKTGISPAERDLIPTWQYYSAEGQSASDNGYVNFGKDGKPALAIGRFPVVKPAEVTAIVNKIIDYVADPQFGAWRQSVMFITNDEVSFQNASNKLAAEVGDLGFTPARVYPKASDKNNLAHQRTIKQDLDSGQLLVHFLGHGGRYIWRTGPPDPTKNHDLFTLDDVASLNNAGRLPMVLSMTCYSAPFDSPNEDSIGERFLREAKDGAIAVFAASWRNAPDPAFSAKLLGDLLKPGITIGDAILAAKNETSNPNMIEMYNLLGDPAVALQRPREQLRMVQRDGRWSRRVAIEVPGATTFHGKLRVEWLDQKHQLIARNDYRIDTPKLVLPAPPAGANEVRAYAVDPSRRNDAIGALTLSDKPWQPFWADWHWPRSPKPLPPASDRVFGSNFGG